MVAQGSLRSTGRAFAEALSCTASRPADSNSPVIPHSACEMIGPAVRAYIAASMLTGACTPGGADGLDNAVSQRLTRSSYRNREHIRPRCGKSSPLPCRFLDDGLCIKQTRTCDIAPGPCCGFRKARVLGLSELSDVAIRAPLETLAHDWPDPPSSSAGVKRRIKLGSRDIDRLKAASAEIDFFQPTLSGLDLQSEDLCSVGVACIDGRLTSDAWKYFCSRCDNLALPQLLFDRQGKATVGREYPRFTLLVDYGSLVETGALF